jgi:tetratricopeptide (TPR) repeat protein
MFYVYSLVERGKSLPRSLKVPSVPEHIAKYAAAYYSLLEGNIPDAKRAFSELRDNGKAKAWGILGLLEAAVSTGNPTGMNEWLVEAGGLPENHVRRRILPFYEAEWKIFCGDYEGLKKILDRQGRDIEPYDYAELLVMYLVRDDRFTEANEVLAKLPERAKGVQDLIVVEADIVEKEYGQGRSTAYLLKAVQQHPEMWAVRLRYAFSLRGGKNPTDRKEAVTILRKIENERPFDWMTQLSIAKAYADLGKLREAIAVLKRHKHLMGHVPYYHIVLGNVGYHLRQDEDVYKDLAVATYMAPRDADALFLAYALAKEKNYSDAIAILKQLVALDPRDIVRMAELIEMYDLAREWSCIPELADRILNSKRHVDADVRAKTQALRDKANSKIQGGKKDACGS